MADLTNQRREARYGMPAADQILVNRFYTIGYSYYFRQAKWALEIVGRVDEGEEPVERLDNFRSDFRLPQIFRADKVDYSGSGHDRGHLVSSANQRQEEMQNSETFLLSNMSPQKPKFNRKIWKELESAVRALDSDPKIFETYVISGPIFDFDKPIKVIGANDSNDVSIPIPHSYFKSILTENDKGTFNMWSFVIANKGTDKDLADFRVPTTQVENYAGILLWEKLRGRNVANEKKRLRKMWTH
ncbi:MAG: DNA/RNA endonuclease G [Rhodospirillaceae bacterium]|nr:DNA/RNA endonuclease G [Rhodospirillaceae bacterium]|tara:strand:- start:17678 stop:18409 length:732 start_codon:yes stop_codon:yes gene_type:complete